MIARPRKLLIGFCVVLTFLIAYLNILSQRSTTEFIPKRTNLTCKCEKDVIEALKINRIGDCTIITLSNFGFRNFTLNWIRSLERNNYTKFVVLSFDLALVNYLSSIGYKDRAKIIPFEWLEYQIPENVTNFKEPAYNLLTQQRVHVYLNLLLKNITFLMSDVDIVWLSPHVLEYIEFNVEHSYAHIAFAQDIWKGKIQYNGGFLYAKPTQFSIRLFSDWIIAQNKDILNSIDQFVLDELLASNNHNDNRIFPLDKLLFASGQVFFHLKKNKLLNINPLMVHANYIIGHDNKLFYFKKNGFWYLE